MDSYQRALSHSGVPGMKWGVRKQRDFNKLKTVSKKSLESANKHFDYVHEHTYSVAKSAGLKGVSKAYISDPKLEAKAMKNAAKVEKMVAKLSKKYSVSAIPDKDLKTGKMFVTVMMDGKSEQVNAD